MARSAICISATDGAGGEEVGRNVAEALGFRLIDEGIILRAAREAGVDPQVVASAEQRKSFLARLFEDLGQGGQGTASLAGYAPMSVEEANTPSGEAIRGLIRTAVEETAAQGQVVILAHAAAVALAEREDVLRVLVTSPPEARAQRLAAQRKLDDGAARKLVQRSDEGRAAYFKRFYDVAAELPTHYDLVVSTERLTPPQAAALIVSAATS